MFGEKNIRCLPSLLILLVHLTAEALDGGDIELPDWVGGASSAAEATAMLPKNIAMIVRQCADMLPSSSDPQYSQNGFRRIGQKHRCLAQILGRPARDTRPREHFCRIALG